MITDATTLQQVQDVLGSLGVSDLHLQCFRGWVAARAVLGAIEAPGRRAQTGFVFGKTLAEALQAVATEVCWMRSC